MTPSPLPFPTRQEEVAKTIVSNSSQLDDGDFAPTDSPDHQAGHNADSGSRARLWDRISSSWRPKSDSRHIRLIDGTGPHLSSQTDTILQHRLRIVALLLFSGFLVAFLAFQATDWIIGSSFDEPFWLSALRITTLVSLGLVGLGMCRSCSLSATSLRVVEFLVFGIPTLAMAGTGFHELVHCACMEGGHAFLPSVQLPFIILIFAYALFIPNHWKRAAGILAVMAIAPVVVVVIANTQAFEVREMLTWTEYANYKVHLFVSMGITYSIATAGVYQINRLRREAFKAQQLGQYRLKESLGSGGMGEVYLAEHQMMKRPCAVKVIHPDKAGDPKILARFEREVRLTAKLSHWNSIDIYDYGRTDDGTFYYVMEFLPGHNLGELVEMEGRLPVNRIVYLADQLCSALAEAHGIGLVHRDIKPANIYCAYRGGVFDVAKLLDFGLAKPILDTQDTALTQAGAITGSPLFMSPEQAMGEIDSDGRSDIYSLGAVLYFATTGKPPFDYGKPMQVIMAHASEQAVPPCELMADCPERLSEIIMQCLAKEPDARFQSVLELQQALSSVPVEQPWTADIAASWWDCNGCPERKQKAAAAIEAAALA